MSRLSRLGLLLAAAVLAGAAAASPTVYVPLGSGNQVIAVDAATDRITASYPGVDNPHGLAATPDGEYLVAGSMKETPPAAGQPADAPTSRLALIHPAHGHVMLTIPVAGWSHHIAISPDGRYAVATHPTRGNISVVDLQSNQVVRTVATGPAPNYAVFGAAGRRLYVSNSGNGTVSEIALPDWKVVRSLPAGPGPTHLALAPDGRTLFVANPGAGKVTAIDLAGGKVKQDWSFGGKLHGLDLGDDGRTLFVSVKDAQKLVALDTASGARRSIDLKPAPYHLNTITGTGKLYLSSRSAPKIWVVDQKTLEVLAEITLPAGEGHQMAIVR